jgi:hypothetical protein
MRPASTFSRLKLDKAFMKRGYAASAENTGLTSHFHRNRDERALKKVQQDEANQERLIYVGQYW